VLSQEQNNISSQVSPEDQISASIQDPSSATLWTGFKLVKDNIDKNIRPSFQRGNHQTKSYHYCHVFAVKDRVDLSSYSDTKPDCSRVDPFCLLPSTDDLAKLKENFAVLISRYISVSSFSKLQLLHCFCRVLVQHVEAFSSQRKEVQWHIRSQYTKEMSVKSEVVSLMPKYESVENGLCTHPIL